MDAIPCAGPDCFDAATHEVVPQGRWLNLPVVKACRGCSKKLAANYKTESGERGWAEVVPIFGAAAPVKKPEPKRRRRK